MEVIIAIVSTLLQIVGIILGTIIRIIFNILFPYEGNGWYHPKDDDEKEDKKEK